MPGLQKMQNFLKVKEAGGQRAEMNYRLLIQYDGTRYAGWQRQTAGRETIQGKIEDVLGRMAGQKVEITGAGRTDAGVHARGQVANVHLPEGKSTEEIRDYLNRYLPEDICVAEVSEAAGRFHSRLNAGTKTYLYRISTNKIKNVFERKYIYDLDEPLDVTKMQEAASYFLGTHDFQGYCARKMKKSTVRRVDAIEFQEFSGELRIFYRGNGFLYHMVRILTGTLIEVGRGERSPESVTEALLTKNRAKAGYTVPAKGLCLVKVEYS